MRRMWVSASAIAIGAALLAAHRPVAEFLHRSEGAQGDRFGGLTRARAVVLVAGAGFALLGALTLSGVLDG